MPNKLIICWSITILSVLACGIHYRMFAAKHGDFTGGKVELPVPLREFPMTIGDWQGKDVELSDAVLKVAGNDDYLNRLYVNSKTGEWFNLYIAYTGDPRTMLGHRPQVCYPGAGWNPTVPVEHLEIKTDSGLTVPCLLHHFNRPGRPGQPEARVVVLNYYILNGKLTDQEDSFDGIGTRAPNIEGQAARYVAQVQISGIGEGIIRSGIKLMADNILRFFPQ